MNIFYQILHHHPGDDPKWAHCKMLKAKNEADALDEIKKFTKENPQEIVVKLIETQQREIDIPPR